MLTWDNASTNLVYYNNATSLSYSFSSFVCFHTLVLIKPIKKEAISIILTFALSLLLNFMN